MRIILYVPRARAAEASAATERLRAEGHTALYRDTRGFAGDIEACDRVVTDDPRIASAHAARGIDVAPFTAEQADAAGGGDPDEGDEAKQSTEGAADPGSSSGVKRPRRTRKRK